jgi:hypothetical protein
MTRFWDIAYWQIKKANGAERSGPIAICLHQDRTCEISIEIDLAVISPWPLFAEC